MVGRHPKLVPVVQFVGFLSLFVLTRWLWLVVSPASADYWEESFRLIWSQFG